MTFLTRTLSAALLLGSLFVPATHTLAQTKSAAITAIVHVDIIPDYAKAQSEERAAQILRVETAATQHDSGLVSYDVLQQNDASNHYTIVETWVDEAAYARHEGSAHTVKFRQDIQEYLGSPFDSRPHHRFQ
ncbi:MAG: antibiotic biosynthesis monooxygenase [Edaphobacter sp.]|uniref:putative quinol monooxygenase n=1 Tax=Edaphobacter sp. TaxID=1934404 RepID=UPI0023A60B48|nr:antibiotic biosynthesis monooxygenase [Edaphobacter sp.]MDE1178281.1 antibiotic biosynthesis monooxygenase [Edaphobacter sp.]